MVSPQCLAPPSWALPVPPRPPSRRRPREGLACPGLGHSPIHGDRALARDDHPALGVQYRQSLSRRTGRGRFANASKDLPLLSVHSQFGVHNYSVPEPARLRLLRPDRSCRYCTPVINEPDRSLFNLTSARVVWNALGLGRDGRPGSNAWESRTTSWRLQWHSKSPGRVVNSGAGAGWGFE